MYRISISVIIPCLNEASIIASTIETVERFLSENFPVHEVIIVDSSSCDDTYAMSAAMAKRYKNLKILQVPKRGKGLAVKTGALNSKYDYIFFTDADLSTPIEKLNDLVSVLEKGSDIAIASRSVRGSNVKGVSIVRKISSRLLNIAVRTLFNLDIRDTQCGFKLFKRAATLRLFNELRTNDYLFDVELLYRANRSGLKIAEVPVVWTNRRESKLNIFKELFTTPIDLLRIRMLHF